MSTRLIASVLLCRIENISTVQQLVLHQIAFTSARLQHQHNSEILVSSAGLTKLELHSIKGPKAIQYDEMLEALTCLQHLHITKVLSQCCICMPASCCVLL